MAMSAAEILQHLGPLAALAGTWESGGGKDVAPSDDRGTERNDYRERVVFTPFGPTDNHEQKLFGLKYAVTAWRLTEPDPFHEEMGFWLWDAAEKQVMRCFVVPRGISVLAGCTTESHAKSFEVQAKLGSPTYGICSNPFLDREFKTVGYRLKIVIHNENEFSYESDTELQLPSRKEIFHHTDQNRLHRVKD